MQLPRPVSPVSNQSNIELTVTELAQLHAVRMSAAIGSVLHFWKEQAVEYLLNTVRRISYMATNPAHATDRQTFPQLESQSQQGGHRPQTPPPVLPPGKLL